jgi:hypothetical protein
MMNGQRRQVRRPMIVHAINDRLGGGRRQPDRVPSIKQQTRSLKACGT